MTESGPKERVAALCEPEEELTPVEKLRLALEMSADAEELMRQNLRRRHPDEDEAQIEARLDAWFLDRPGAPGGDCPGTVRPWRRR